MGIRIISHSILTAAAALFSHATARQQPGLAQPWGGWPAVAREKQAEGPGVVNVQFHRQETLPQHVYRPDLSLGPQIGQTITRGARKPPTAESVDSGNKTKEDPVEPMDYRVLPKRDTVEMVVHYETMCPFCQKLFATGFDVFQDPAFRERVKLDLLPFGNAQIVDESKISSGYHFWHETATYPLIVCQHGETECLGNMIQACTLSMFSEKAVPFVICMEKSSLNGHGIEMASGECAEKHQIDLIRVKECVRSNGGKQLMASLGQRSMDAALNRSYVPWVMINGVHAELDDEHNLLAPLCNALTPPLPSSCDSVMNAMKAKAVKSCHGVSCSAMNMIKLT